MALDPSIPLSAGKDVPQFDPAGAASKGLTLRQLATSVQYQPQVIEANLDATRTATAAVRQKFDEDARQLAASRRLAEITKGQAKVDPKTGKLSIDHRAVATMGAAEGLPIEAVFGHLSKAIKNEADQLKTDADKEDYLRQNAGVVANLMRNAPDEQRAQQMLSAFLQGDARVVGEDKATTFYGELFGSTQPGTLRDSARGISTSLSISEAQERGLIPGGTSTEQLDPKSKLNARDRAVLQSLGISVPEGTTREQLRNLEPLRKFIEGGIAGEGTVVGGINEASDASAARQTYTRALELGEDIKRRFPTRAGSTVQAKIAELVTQDPAYAGINAAIADYNNRNKTDISIAKDGLDPVLERLKTQDNVLRSVQESGAAKATSPNLRRVGEMKVTPQQQFERDKDAIRLIQDEWRKTKPGSEDRAAIERELKRMGGKPPTDEPVKPAASAAPTTSTPKGTTRKFKGTRYMKLNDGPDNDKMNWKAL